MNTHDNLVLVAPRPVRLTGPPIYFHHRSPSRGLPSRSILAAPSTAVSSPADQLDRLKVNDENDAEDQRVAVFSPFDTPSASISDKDPASPCASPRPGTLPSEALEEFLSILRPSFFPPTSPILRTRWSNVSTFPYERPAYKRTLAQHNPKADSIDDSILSDRTININNTVYNAPEPISAGEKDELDELPARWYTSAALSSPISRTHTRNPFQRHPSYDISFSSTTPAPTASSTSSVPLSPISLSPAAIPLPLPTPDEIFAFSSS